MRFKNEQLKEGLWLKLCIIEAGFKILGELVQ
jgi:hypothetical protein